MTTTSLNLLEILGIITIHFIADFICQDEKWAIGKSKNFRDLINHTKIYSLIWFIFGILIITLFDNTDSVINYNPGDIVLFTFITFIFHTITDFFTSKIVSKKFENKHYGSAIPNFGAFTIIGFDQVLHYIQLFVTYYLLFK